jgi:hypothetical protein
VVGRSSGGDHELKKLERQVLTCLWTGRGVLPFEYVEMTLCRDLYHCTPTQLDEQDWQRVQAHLTAHRAEMRVRNAPRAKK